MGEPKASRKTVPEMTAAKLGNHIKRISMDTGGGKVVVSYSTGFFAHAYPADHKVGEMARDALAAGGKVSVTLDEIEAAQSKIRNTPIAWGSGLTIEAAVSSLKDAVAAKNKVK